MNVVLSTYADQCDAICSVRVAVFVEEQAVPLENEMDDRDAACVHALAFDEARPVATGRLDCEQGGRIGRVAMLADYRGRGIGKEVMQALEAEAKRRGFQQTWLHAQVAVIPFYRQLGYCEEGSTFTEENILHQTMRKCI
ncbi:GNAT family N-acetyltransferase [Planctomycetota bacterium]